MRTSTGSMVAVNVDELSSALGKEVTALRSELFLIRNEREQELRTVRCTDLILRCHFLSNSDTNTHLSKNNSYASLTLIFVFILRICSLTSKHYRTMSSLI